MERSTRISSLVIDEDENYITVKEFLQLDNTYFADWELNEFGEQRFPREVSNNLHYRLFDVEFTIKIDKNTGEYKILEVRDGYQILT